jgi:hypothetical protein
MLSDMDIYKWSKFLKKGDNTSKINRKPDAQDCGYGFSEIRNILNFDRKIMQSKCGDLLKSL